MLYHYFGRKILEKRTKICIYFAAIMTIINMLLDKLIVYISSEIIYLESSSNFKVFGVSNIVIYSGILVAVVFYLLNKLKSSSAAVVEIMYFIFKILTIIISLIFSTNIIFIICKLI